MSNVSNNAANAFHRFKVFRSGKTNVIITDTGTFLKASMYIYDTKIAGLLKNKITGEEIQTIELQYNDKPLTRNRLNSLDNVYITKKNRKTYLNGREWNGQKIDINEWNKL